MPNSVAIVSKPLPKVLNILNNWDNAIYRAIF